MADIKRSVRGKPHASAQSVRPGRRGLGEGAKRRLKGRYLNVGVR